ncbi:hypothetical protein GCM10022377_24550 [Zhihengliuella alba]|uniref:N-acetyltransferase domain-containing protein n=1 Tax=Zhihengliuella alba TaxID=547018 RepID=A0ABP7DU56_9MICC
MSPAGLSVAIRKATAEDVRPTLEMKLAAWRETYGDVRPESFFAAKEAGLEKETDWWLRGLAAGAEFWIALDADGAVIGCAGGTPVQDDDADTGVPVELQMLYVRAAYYGTGLGERLLQTAVGVGPALAWVVQGNERAIAFYRKHGFAPDGRVEPCGDWGDGVDWTGLNEVRLVRR